VGRSPRVFIKRKKGKKGSGPNREYEGKLNFGQTRKERSALKSTGLGFLNPILLLPYGGARVGGGGGKGQ